MNWLNEKIPLIFDKEEREENLKSPVQKIFEEEFGEKGEQEK